MSFVRKIDWALDKISSHLLVVSALVILFFSTLSIMLRWFHVNLQWIEPMLRHLVFICAFLGGVVATGKGTHVGIDRFAKFVESQNWPHLKIWISRFTMFVSWGVLLWLIKAGIDFTFIEMEFSKDVGLGFLQSGQLVAIIPIGLSLIALRFFLRLIFSFEGTVFFTIAGVPLFIIMSLAALLAFSFSGVQISALAQDIYRVSSAPTLMAIALFTLAGYLMAQSRSSKRFSILMNFAGAFFLYALVAKVDIDKLVKAGIVPGIFVAFIFVLRAAIKKVFILKDFTLALKDAWPEVLLAIGIFVGISSGYLSITDVAVLTAFYVFVTEVFIYRHLSFSKDVPRVVVDSMSMAGGILLLLCCALAFSNFLVDEEILSRIVGLLKIYLTDKYSFLFFLNVFLLVVGYFMNILSAIIVVIPLMIPIAAGFGVDPVHLAIIFLANLGIGYLVKKPITEVYKASGPLLILLTVTLLIITYIPDLSLFWFK